MNAMQHARISAKRWGGEPEDYYEIHAFIDSTKSLCSDARHRVLHTLWGINSVVVPIRRAGYARRHGRAASAVAECLD